MAPAEAVPCLALGAGLGSGQGAAGPPHSTATGSSTGARSRAAGASSAPGTGPAGLALLPGAVGCPAAQGPRLGDALPEAQHGSGRRDRAASPPAQGQFYKKRRFD